MQAVILCGGRGTRLGAETELRPKPMVQVGGRPLLWHIMKHYAHHGYKDFILCLGYKGEAIKDYFLHYEDLSNDFTIRLGNPREIEYHSNHLEQNWRVTLADTGLEAMTGARVKRIAKYIEGDCFLLTYGDGVSDVDIGELVRFHGRHGKIGTVTGVRPSSRFGELMLNGNTVVEFSEKPQASQGYINGGFFAFHRKFLDYLSEDDDCILERDPLEHLAQDGQLVMFSHSGFWHCVDTPRDYEHLKALWDRGKAPWRLWVERPCVKPAGAL